MTHAPSLRPLSFWARLAVWLGFIAVLSALVVPASLLAEEVRTGKLGGLCSAQQVASPAGEGAASRGDAAQQGGSHCDWCGQAVLALPPAALSALWVPAVQVAATRWPTPQPVGARLGLPFSRGPPAV